MNIVWSGICSKVFWADKRFLVLQRRVHNLGRVLFFVTVFYIIMDV